MKDYPDKMTPEQARRFGEEVLNIVVPNTLWEGDDLWAYSSIGGMAKSFKDGGTHIEIYAWGGEIAIPSGGEQRGTYCSRVESPADIAGRRGCPF